MGSKVYFTDFHCSENESQLTKLIKLVKQAGIDEIDFQDKYVAVKIHFGEWGNLAFLRQQYARVICDYIKSKGGKPFLTDCNTLYAGYRHNALDHLDCAYMNGYNPLATGVHSIIADGLRGTDEREIPVEGGEYIEKAKIGSAIAEADIIISMTHFKGHMSAGFGGVLKNIGMGCGSKKGKMEMHSHGTPHISKKKCIGCGMCVKNCNYSGVSVIDKIATIDETKCVGCGHCFSFCPKGAIACKWDEAEDIMNKKIAEYTKAVLFGKPSFHISFINNVSPDCDCEPTNDIPIIPDLGMFAGFDPVAIDQACGDMANKAEMIEGSKLDKKCHEHHHDEDEDIFHIIHPDSRWQVCVEHAEKLGIGTSDYELIEI